MRRRQDTPLAHGRHRQPVAHRYLADSPAAPGTAGTVEGVGADGDGIHSRGGRFAEAPVELLQLVPAGGAVQAAIEDQHGAVARRLLGKIPVPPSTSGTFRSAALERGRGGTGTAGDAYGTTMSFHSHGHMAATGRPFRLDRWGRPEGRAEESGTRGAGTAVGRSPARRGRRKNGSAPGPDLLTSGYLSAPHDGGRRSGRCVQRARSRRPSGRVTESLPG